MPSTTSVLPASADGWAFFLDVDGTLIDIAPTPGAAEIPPSLPGMLMRLSKRAGGALAIVSGRPLESLDRFFAPARLPSAGIHGAEIRHANGHQELLATEAIEDVRGQLRALGAEYGLLVEEKSVSVTIHFRSRPEVEPKLAAAMSAIIAAEPHLALQPGKMMLEVRPAGADKGRALSRFMEEPPFAGRRPLAIGDDFTDEHMFAVAVELGGLAVRVGTDRRETAAAIHLDGPSAVRSWLSMLAHNPT
jgi:trehalose 6-phosphate phosphatase